MIFQIYNMVDEELPSLGQPTTQDNLPTANVPGGSGLAQSIAKEVSEPEKIDEGKKSLRREVMVSGLIKDKDNFVSGAVITIKDENNLPAKTLISNKEGFFKTELIFGKNQYVIEVAHPSLKFKPVAINLNDESVKNLTITSETV